LNNLGLTCLDAGNVERAVSCFEEVLRRRPGTVMAMVNLSSALNKQGKAKESEQLLRKALEIEPENPDALNNLANLLIVDNRLVEALEVARRAVAAGPRHAESHIALGTALSRLGRLEEALPFLKARAGSGPAIHRVPPGDAVQQALLDGMDAYALAAEHRRWAECFAPPLYKGRRYRNVPDPERRLRIGFVSAISARIRCRSPCADFRTARSRPGGAGLLRQRQGRRHDQPSEVQRPVVAADR